MDAKPSKRDRLLEKQRQLAAQLAKLNARESAAERKNDTRRKILIGGSVLESLRRGEYSQATLASLLDKSLVHNRDRVLFDFLEPLGSEPAKALPSPAPAATPEPAQAAPSPAPAPDPQPAATLPLEPAGEPAPQPRPRPTRFHHPESPDMKDYL